MLRSINSASDYAQQFGSTCLFGCLCEYEGRDYDTRNIAYELGKSKERLSFERSLALSAPCFQVSETDFELLISETVRI